MTYYPVNALSGYEALETHNLAHTSVLVGLNPAVTQ